MKKSNPEKIKPKYNMVQNSAYMISLAWKNCRSILGYLAVTVILAVVRNLIGLFVTPTVIGAVETSASLSGLLTVILLFTGGLILINGLSSYIGTNSGFGRIELRCKIVGMIHSKYTTTSYPNTDSQDMQKKLDKARMSVNNNNSATEAIWGTIGNIATNIIGFIIYVFVLMSMNPIMMLVVLVTTIPGFFIDKYILGWGYRHRDEEAEYSKRMNYVNDNASDYKIAKDIRIFGMRDWLEDIYASAFNLYKGFIKRSKKFYLLGDALDLVLTFARNGVAYFYLINMIFNNGISAAEFLLYFSAIGGFTSWVKGILSGFISLHGQSLNLSMVREFIEYPEVFKFDEGESLPPDLNKSYEIELRNVTFRYPEAESNTLEDINLKITAGEKLAVVGLNGAGKTTLVKLICGFYDPTEGEVLLNGINIKRYNRRDYYKHFSAVFQDFSILSSTLTNNIVPFNMKMDTDKLNDCIEKAGLTAKIDSMPNKFDTNLGKDVYEDGIDLSGGETQRLMLARALYKDAPIIILDEPTAALDPIAESDLYNKYNDLTGGRTAVYISHRLASTRFCDRIILIDDNKITESGTHKSLLKSGGKYAELFEIQSRYYRKGEMKNGF